MLYHAETMWTSFLVIEAEEEECSYVSDVSAAYIAIEEWTKWAQTDIEQDSHWCEMPSAFALPLDGVVD